MSNVLDVGKPINTAAQAVVGVCCTLLPAAIPLIFMFEAGSGEPGKVFEGGENWRHAGERLDIFTRTGPDTTGLGCA